MTDKLAEPQPELVALHDVVASWRMAQPAVSRRVSAECLCDGPRIVAETSEPADIYAAVQRHQIEPVHIAYDQVHGIPLSRPQLNALAIDGGRA